MDLFFLKFRRAISPDAPQKRLERVAYVVFDNGFQSNKLIEEFQKRRIAFILPLRGTVKLERRWRWMRYARRFNYRTEGVEVDVVEAQSRSEEVVIGEQPSLVNPPSGGRFHPRCPYAFEKCRSVKPEQITVGTDRWAACHLLT